MGMACLAYFLTWTTYGTWLHGDERGSVDDLHNRYGDPVVEADRSRRERVLSRQREPSLVLSNDDRRDVTASIRQTCEIRGWGILALNVRTNHIHLVVSTREDSPEHVVAIAKSWATRRLKETGRHPGRTKFWTNQASTRMLFFKEAVRGAVRYTMEQ